MQERGSGLDEAANVASLAKGAVKTGKALAAAAKGGAVGGPYGAVAGALWEGRKHIGKIVAVVAVLLLLPVLGGSVGALLGMKVFRHKTLHRTFRLGVPVILALQILVPFGLWLYFQVIR